MYNPTHAFEQNTLSLYYTDRVGNVLVVNVGSNVGGGVSSHIALHIVLGLVRCPSNLITIYSPKSILGTSN